MALLRPHPLKETIMLSSSTSMSSLRSSASSAISTSSLSSPCASECGSKQLGPPPSCPFSQGASFAKNPHDPIATSVHAEFDLILRDKKCLATTGCTPKFCQAGRATHTDEERLGDNRPLSVVKEEAIAFLAELKEQGVYSDAEFNSRLAEVLQNIEDETVEGTILVDGEKKVGLTATWTQTPTEICHGMRLAWKNARRCIMRSHYQELMLCDLRHVTTSTGMISAVIDHCEVAFNDGKIQPTAFVFPPRSTKGTGPMFWSKQLLNFAAYRFDDGTVIGDPSNVDLTNDIISLGWVPPENKTDWDMLPIVAMAENDAPAMAEVPEKLRRLVEINHPHYAEGFKKIALKWYQFPALSRFGFDIGGVQYTAAPFIGWYMDAEIGVRNLADTFRYNMLPKVAEAIGFNVDEYRQREEYKAIEGLQDLPDHEQLLWLSRAQAELNYAVRWSFLQDGVAMSGSLAASADFSRFDDEHRKKHGYRLNSDPYWLAPPQGSIIPVWHRGGAPNYQPKPLIAKHRCDPVNAWNRRKYRATQCPQLVYRESDVWTSRDLFEQDPKVYLQKLRSTITTTKSGLLDAFTGDKIHIYFASTGTTAEQLAKRLRDRVEQASGPVVAFESLNALSFDTVKNGDFVLVLASTTGNGDLPANGNEIEARADELKEMFVERSIEVKFAVFGVGDSGYPKTFNAASAKVDQTLRHIGLTALTDGPINGDVAVEPFPLTAFNRWWELVQSRSRGEADASSNPAEAHVDQTTMIKQFDHATVTGRPVPASSYGRIAKVILDVGDVEYEDMSHIRVLPSNSEAKVSEAMAALGLAEYTPEDHPETGVLGFTTYAQFFRHIVDLEGTFTDLTWLTQIIQIDLADAASLSVIDLLRRMLPPTSDGLDPALLRKICLSMPLLRTRSFSVASTQQHVQDPQTLELLIKIHPGGRFSDTFLSADGSALKVALVKHFPGRPLLAVERNPVLVVATGTGWAPVRSLVRRRIQQAKHATKAGLGSPFPDSPMTIFLGFKPEDKRVFLPDVLLAQKLGLVDHFVLVPSNPQKVRVQDHLPRMAACLREKLLDRGGYVFVCGSAGLVSDVQTRLGEIVGGDVKATLQERYIEEVY